MTPNTHHAQSSTTSSSSFVDFLCLLDAYSTSKTKGSADIKASIWNIHKARRSAGSFHLGGSLAFTAQDVREDICARAVLSLTGEHEFDGQRTDQNLAPALVSEGDQNISTDDDAETVKIEKDFYTLHLDGIPRAMKDETKEKHESISKEENLVQVGLRHRKGNQFMEQKENMGIKTNKMKLDLNELDNDLANSEDPIELFGGLTPLDLKVAQMKARASLISFVEAANLVQEMQLLMDAKQRV